MESIRVQADSDKTGTTVVLDIESLLAQTASDRCSGSPKMTRALSRKWSYRSEKWSPCTEEEDIDELGKRSLIRVNSQFETLKQINKALARSTTTPSNVPVNPADNADGRSKRFSRLMTINPRKILYIFATASSMGTMILIYCTLAIN